VAAAVGVLRHRQNPEAGHFDETNGLAFLLDIGFMVSLFPRVWFCDCGPEETKNLAGRECRLIQIRLATPSWVSQLSR
jgi:hypothetical protein